MSIRSYSQEMTSVMTEEFPFNVKFEKKVKLPDSLKISNFQNGFSVLSVKLNSKGKIEGFNIMKMSLKVLTGKGLEFSQGNQEIQGMGKYPKEVQSYYYFFSNYVAKMKISKKEKLKVHKHNFFSILVRLT